MNRNKRRFYESDFSNIEREVESALSSLTNQYTKEEGTVETSYEDEKNFAKKILRTHYKIVEVSDGRRSANEPMSWVISYAEPSSSVDEDIEVVATDLVRDLYDKFPELYFIDESDSNQGIVLMFENALAISQDELKKFVGSYADKYDFDVSVMTSFRGDRLNILIKKHTRAKTESVKPVRTKRRIVKEEYDPEKNVWYFSISGEAQFVASDEATEEALNGDNELLCEEFYAQDLSKIDLNFVEIEGAFYKEKLPDGSYREKQAW